jgi:hypothetical protein
MVGETNTVWPFAHQPPVMFCGAGDKSCWIGDVQDSFKSGYDNPVPWPLGSHIRFKLMWKERHEPVIKKLIEAMLDEWLKNMTPMLSGGWVDSGAEAEVRISFYDSKPNWSAVGPRALRYPQSVPTMNFQYGGWKESKAIYSQAQIARVAGHLFGHALGL